MSKATRILFRLTVGGALLLGALVADAANLSFLNDTPVSYMKQRDVDSLRKAAFSALDTKQDGEAANWVNEGTGNSVRIEAKMTPSDTKKDGNPTCRTLTAELVAKGQLMNFHPLYCRQDSGAWQLQKKN